MTGTHSIAAPSNPASQYPGTAPEFVMHLISLCNKFNFIKRRLELALLCRLYDYY